MKRPTAIIADDEPLLRDALARMLADAWSELLIIGYARNGREAIEMFDERKPAICFLDVQMPGKSGVEAAQHIGRRAHLVFVTAFDQYAVQAFAQGALDYLVKPVEPARLADTVARLKERWNAAQPASHTEALLQQHKSGVLSVSTSPNFASKWLVHRLGRFAEQHPAIVLKLSASLQHVDFAREDFDLAIRHGDGQWPGLHVTRLCEEELFPVCSPALARSLRTPGDLKKHTLLHIDERRDWGAWLEKAGAGGVDFARGPVFNQASMAIDAAVDGQGVALARSALAAWDLGAGRLVRPFAASLKLPYSYWIVCPKPTASLPKIATFRSWLLSEAAGDAQRIKRTAGKARR